MAAGRWPLGMRFGCTPVSLFATRENSNRYPWHSASSRAPMQSFNWPRLHSSSQLEKMPIPTSTRHFTDQRTQEKAPRSSPPNHVKSLRVVEVTRVRRFDKWNRSNLPRMGEALVEAPLVWSPSAGRSVRGDRRALTSLRFGRHTGMGPLRRDPRSNLLPLFSRTPRKMGKVPTPLGLLTLSDDIR